MSDSSRSREASREAFEKWLMAAAGDGTSDDYLKRIRRKDGSYSSTLVTSQWLAWQANEQPPQCADALHEAHGQWWMVDAPSFKRPTEAYEATRLAFRAGAKWSRSQTLEEAAREVEIAYQSYGNPDEMAERAMQQIRALKEQKQP